MWGQIAKWKDQSWQGKWSKLVCPLTFSFVFHISALFGQRILYSFRANLILVPKKVEIAYFKANIFNLDKKNRFEETCLVCCRYDKKYIERQYHLKGDTCLSGKSCHATQIGKMLFLRKEIFSGSFLLEQANIEILLSLNNLFGGLLN